MTFHSEFEMFNSLEEAEDTIDALNVYIAYLKGRIEKLECENEELMEKLWYTMEITADIMRTASPAIPAMILSQI